MSAGKYQRVTRKKPSIENDDLFFYPSVKSMCFCVCPFNPEKCNYFCYGLLHVKYTILALINCIVLPITGKTRQTSHTSSPILFPSQGLAHPIPLLSSPVSFPNAFIAFIGSLRALSVCVCFFVYMCVVVPLLSRWTLKLLIAALHPELLGQTLSKLSTCFYSFQRQEREKMETDERREVKREN